MGIQGSSYAVLGLSPGADAAAVDEAYRRLIKQYHPDRSGGDPARAAEINRAYFELRRERPSGAPEASVEEGTLAAAIYARRAARTRSLQPVRRRRRPWPLALLAVIALLTFQRDRVLEAVQSLRTDASETWRPVLSSSESPAQSVAALDAPLMDAEVRSSLAAARVLTGGSPDDAVAEHSRACHRDMRAEPTLALLDRCAAFDYAVAILQKGDPVDDRGPFSASAVTSRQMAAANLLSSDFLEIEARLDRIRGQVELALAPPPLELPELSGAQTPA